MAFRRTLLEAFQLANDAYVNATVTWYKVNPETGENTEVLATLYEDYTGTDVLTNPITLDSDGKFAAPVYIETPVIGVITASTVGNHSTGAIFPNNSQYKSDWAASTEYLPGDIVKDGAAGSNTGNYYIAGVAHTSGSSWTTDLAANKFVIFLEVEDVISAKNDAEAAATAAAGSETVAAAAAVSAASSASSADTSRLSAAAHDTSALGHKNDAETAATAAAASAASNNLPTPTANKHGALLYQNDDDDGHDALTSLGSAGSVLQSGGDDAAPSYGKTVKSIEADTLIISGVM